MVPLLEKLQLFWSGVDVWDITKLVGHQSFKMHGIFMWAIHDLPTYGLLLGHVTKGYKGCMACGPNTCSRHSKKLCKTTYIDHHRWLLSNHPYWRNAHDFNGKFERRSTPNVVQGFQVLDHAIAYEAWKQDGGMEDDNPCLHNGMKQRNVLFDLPYWKVWINNQCFNIIMLLSIVSIVEFVHNETPNWPILLPLLKGCLLGLLILN